MTLFFSATYLSVSRPRRASCLACTCSLEPGGGDGELVRDACPWWPRSALASYKRETAEGNGNWKRSSIGQDGTEKERMRMSFPGEAISIWCKALAGREDISRVQGRADKECHIITSPYGLRLFDPIYLWGQLVTQAQWEICSSVHLPSVEGKVQKDILNLVEL